MTEHTADILNTEHISHMTITCIQLFWERLSEKVHATILKGIVGDFKCTVFQRNLKESYGRPLIYVCECWRKVTKVGSTATVVRNTVLIISHITFRDCRVHFILNKLSRNSCMLELVDTTTLTLEVNGKENAPLGQRIRRLSILWNAPEEMAISMDPTQKG